MFQYLVTYQNLNFLINIAHKEDIYHAILNRLNEQNIDPPQRFCISIYHETYNLFIVLNSIDELPDNGRLKFERIEADL
jgi:hypothetical protein